MHTYVLEQALRGACRPNQRQAPAASSALLSARQAACRVAARHKQQRICGCGTEPGLPRGGDARSGKHKATQLVARAALRGNCAHEPAWRRGVHWWTCRAWRAIAALRVRAQVQRALDQVAPGRGNGQVGVDLRRKRAAAPQPLVRAHAVANSALQAQPMGSRGEELLHAGAR